MRWYSKQWIAAMLAGMAVWSVQAEVIVAAWDGASDPKITSNRVADIVVPGLSAVQTWSTSPTTNDWIYVNNGSDDLTFGSSTNGARESTTTATGAYMTKATNSTWMTFALVNSSSTAYSLNTFAFDAWRMNNQASGAYTLSIVAGDLGINTNVAAGTFVSQGGLPPTGGADYEDVDITLTNLSQSVLGAGQSVTFLIDFAKASSVANFYFDNVAILAEPIPASAFLLAGWHGAQNADLSSGRAADTNLVGIAAAVRWSDDGATLGTHWKQSAAGSNDETYGPFAGAPSFTGLAVDGALFSKNLANDAYMDFSITNNSAAAYDLISFSFDAWRSFPTGSSQFNLSIVAGDLPLTSPFASGSLVSRSANPSPAGTSDYQDFDYALAGLTLEAGQSVTIRLALDRSSDPAGNGDVYIDHVAVFGTEPSSLDLSAEFVQVQPVAGGKIKLTMSVTGDPKNYQLLATSDLVFGGWGAVAHSDDGVNPSVVTNLSYATDESGNRVVYVDGGDAQKFFGIEY